MKQALLFAIAACGLAAASSTNNSTKLSANVSSQPFELIFPKSEPTKEHPWTIKVVLSRINTKKSRFTGPSTTNLSLSLIGQKTIELQGGTAYESIPTSSKPAQSGPYNTVTFELGFGDKYTGNDKRISDAITDARGMIEKALAQAYSYQVSCFLFDDKGRKIALSPDPSDRGMENTRSSTNIESPSFPLYGTTKNATEKPARIGAASFFFAWGTREVSNVTCSLDLFQGFDGTSQAYHVTLEDKPAKAGGNMTTAQEIQSYTELSQNYTGVAEKVPQPPNGGFESQNIGFGPMSVFPLPPKRSNDSTAEPGGPPKGVLSGLKATAVGMVKKARTRGSSAKQEYSKVTMEVGDALRPDSRCQILDTAGKTISVAGEDGKAVTTFPMGRYTFHEPKRSQVGKILCGPFLGQ
ncbi:uncharacterized protein PgNI_03717 [Pyricularia grisea]|uniref:Uncharacterized protein n=1 Tax=Pyricularia grisea TaxID=148305 RepID=A0A6P8BEL7_PYRGI|nr:uncharacterized protein PgNI_03717 [Pyricularia grisea]TLD14137.1 hypothetical protein PgNI_03717 [Pyricularia grisea]